MFERGFGLACALVLIGMAGTAQAATVSYDGTRLIVVLQDAATVTERQIQLNQRVDGTTDLFFFQPVTDNTGSAGGCSSYGNGRGLLCTTGGRPVPATITGTASDDRFFLQGSQPFRVEAGGGNDTVFGGAGADTLLGGDGNDGFQPAGGADVVDGGAGDDGLDYGDRTAPVRIDLSKDELPDGDVVTAIDRFAGTAGNDVFIGSSGPDSFLGLGGDDHFLGGAGADRLFGNEGSDTVDYSERSVPVSVDLTTNAPAAAPDGDLIDAVENAIGGGGSDTLRGNRRPNRLAGGGGGDVLLGGEDDDVLDPGPGNDRLQGGAGTDTVTYALRATGVTALATGRITGPGGEVDLLDAPAPGDVETILGGAGANDLAAGGVVSRLVGGAANDVLTASAARPLTLDGGSGGTDRVSYAEVPDGVVVHLDGAAGGRDALTGIDDVTGGPGADAITGNAAANTIDGGAGDDVVTGAGGTDVLAGGEGTDTASFADRTTGVTATLGAGGLTGFEALVGGSGNDVLTGDATANTIRGGAGNDTIRAKDGVVDTIDCGEGDDDASDGDLDDARTACERAPEAPRPPAQDGGGTQGSTQTGTTPPAVVRPRRQATALAVRTAAGGRLRAVTLRGLPKGARVRLTCKGGRAKGCPRTRSLTARGRTLALTRFAATRLRAGAVLRITVTAPGFAPRRFTLTGRRTGAPKRATTDLPA